MLRFITRCKILADNTIQEIRQRTILQLRHSSQSGKQFISEAERDLCCASQIHIPLAYSVLRCMSII